MTNFMINRVKTCKKNLIGQLILLLVGIYGFMPSTSYANVQCVITRPGEIRTYPVVIYNIDIPGTSKELSLRGTRMDCVFNKPTDKTGKIIFEIDPTAPKNTVYPEAIDTNLAGIGIKYAIGGNAACTMKPNTTTITCDVKFNEKLVHFVIYRNFFMTAAIQNFGYFNIPQGNITYYLEEDGATNAQSLPMLLDATQGFVSKNACTLNTPTVNFNLGEHQQNTFRGIGSTGQEKTQPIILSCHPKTKYSLTVNGDDAGKPGVIKLTQEPGVASGIGVQLLTAKDNQPILLATKTEIGTSAAKGTDLEVTINITARYYQTDTQITPGKANASATFTVTYQ